MPPSPEAGTQGAACLNCGAALGEPRPRFCGQCGQETRLRAPTIGEFVQQFGGAYFSTEGALWRTLALLLARPGELTRRYLAGQRKHYVLPLRLYLTISLATLLALQLATPELKLDGKNGPFDAKRDLTVLQVGPNTKAGLERGKFYCEGFPPWVCRRLQARLDMDERSFRRELLAWPQRFLSRWGTAMFLLVPIFALLQMLAYFGRRLRYTEHLVYALHVHSFWFLGIALSLLPLPAISAVYLAMPIYTLMAARRVYGGGWWSTIARALLVALPYGAVLGVALGIVALWAFFFG
jgi:hypothetical protein